MSSEEQTTDTSGTAVDKMETENMSKTDDEKEDAIDKNNEETKEPMSPTPEYTPPGSQVSLRNADENKDNDDNSEYSGESNKDNFVINPNIKRKHAYIILTPLSLTLI